MITQQPRLDPFGVPQVFTVTHPEQAKSLYGPQVSELLEQSEL